MSEKELILRSFTGDDEDRTVVTGYMCAIDWEFEVGQASGGSRVYPSITDLRDHHVMWDKCGIVEVEVRIKRTIAEPKEHEF